MLMDCIDRIAMLLTQGGGLWAAGVSGVYVNAVVPFHRVLAISRPLAQLTRGIIGIKEWDCVTLASHSHSSNGASHRGRVIVCTSARCVRVCGIHTCECVFAMACLCRECVCCSLTCEERERGVHTSTLSFKGNPWRTDSSVRPRVLSLASSQTAEQREIWKTVRRLTSPRAETLTSSPGRAEISRGDNRERGNCTSESPAGSDTPSTNQLTSKRSHGAWQPGRSLIANLQNLTVVLPWESTPSGQWGLENRPEDWKWMLSFAIDVSYLLLDNAT